MENFEINNKPNAQELWEGIGGNFDSLSQIVCEFIDNSISNFKGNQCPQKNILISIKNLSNENKVKISIEDSGTGIINLNSAFTLGSKDGAESPYSEHGFGMKHALASANPNNDAWAIYTRTREDTQKNKFKKISCPYKIDNFQGQYLEMDQWPQYGIYGNSGTIIEFECDWSMFSSLSRGLTGGITRFDTLCDILYEDIGFIYANIILKGEADISLRVCDNNTSTTYPITAVQPTWTDTIGPGEGSTEYDLGGGNVKINYHFGRMDDSKRKIDKNGNEITRQMFNNEMTRKYYAKNMSTSGVELRFNGRLMISNLFKEIWGIEKHNTYNDLLITIDLISDNINALPATRTSKNGLREGDIKLERLYEWIKGYMHEPPKNLKDAEREIDIFQRLKEIKIAQIEEEPKTVETEHYVFENTGYQTDRERIDLYVKYNNNVIIYEGKKEKTSAKDVYQLRMYWDGLVYDNITPTKAVIIAKEHSSGVKTLVSVINNMTDAKGNKYNFIIKTWKDESITEI